MNPLEQFVAQAPPLDDVREDAARVCEETARWLRGERGPLQMPSMIGATVNAAEFPDAAFGVAGEVAVIVGEAMKAMGMRFHVDVPWTTAATLLRNGWQRGHRLIGHAVGKEPAS